MISVDFRSSGNKHNGILSVYENGKKEILSNNAGNVYFMSQNKTKLFYLENGGSWSEGDLYIKEENKAISLIAKKVRMIHMTNDCNTVLFLENYSNLRGQLCLIKDQEKKIIDDDVYSMVVYIEKENANNLIFYCKEDEYKYDYYIYDINSHKKNKFATNMTNPILFKTDTDKIRIVGIKETKPYVGTLYVFEDDNLCYEKNNIPTDDFIIEDNGKSVYYYNNNTIYFNEFNSEGTKIIKNNASEDDFFNLKKDKIMKGELELQNSVDISKINNFNVRFTKHVGKHYYIACELAKKAKNHFISESIYPLDDSMNHTAVYSLEQTEDLLLILYTLTKGWRFPPNKLFNYKIYNVDIESLLKTCNYAYGILGFDPGHAVLGNYLTLGADEKIYNESVRDNLMAYHGFKYRTELDSYISNNIKKSFDMDSYACFLFLDSKGVSFPAFGCGIAAMAAVNKDKTDLTHAPSINQLLKSKIDFIEEELVLQNKIPSKWKSEDELFKMIKTQFPNAKYHASPVWLSPQHFDVFLEEEKIAFEYQGIQHFKVIDFFGGEEGFSKRLENDFRKKQICKKHNVTLIEWMFDEPLTKKVLKEKLNIMGIKI